MKEGIKKVARKVWRAIIPEYLNSLYEFMPRRMAAVIAAGGATPSTVVPSWSIFSSIFQNK